MKWLICKSEEKSLRGGNKDTLPQSFQNPCLRRGFLFEWSSTQLKVGQSSWIDQDVNVIGSFNAERDPEDPLHLPTKKVHQYPG